MYPQGKNNQVLFLKVADAYDYHEMVHQALPKGNVDKVCIKPNLCIMKPWNTGVTTDPALVAIFIDGIREVAGKNTEIVIVESDATINRMDLTFKALGYKHLAKEKNVRLMNLTHDKKSLFHLDNGLVIQKLTVARTLMTCDWFLSICGLKTHMLTKVSLNLKNMFGCLPLANKIHFHSMLDETIVDINRVLAPSYCVIDGRISLRGCGPTSGRSYRTGVSFMGPNAVSVDSAGAYFMGYKPRKIKHIRLAEDNGLGSSKFEISGNKSLYKHNVCDFPLSEKLRGCFRQIRRV
jgi:uncharacterized protein (DUF362 family)